jgi:hypothetical protein
MAMTLSRRLGVEQGQRRDRALTIGAMAWRGTR